MPADFSNYIDLSVFDLEPGDIYRDSLELARLSLPQFELRTGTPEDAIFQAMAYVSALNISAINRLPNRLMSGVMAILGFNRQEGVASQVDVVFTLSSYSGGTVPAGTVVSYETYFEDELQEYAFQTLEAVEISEVDPEEDPNYPSATITCSCLTLGIIPPISANAELNVISAGTNIFTAIVASPSNFVNGVNADTDSDYLSRSATYLRSLSSTINKSSQLDSYILTTFPGVVGRVRSYDLTNGDSTSGDITVSRTSGVIKTFRDGTTNIGTVQTEAPHLFIAGDTVRLSNCGPFSGDFEVLATSASTIVFTSVGSNSASTVVTGSAYAGEDDPGYVSVFGYGLNTFLTQTEKLGIKTEVSDSSVAGLTVNVLDPTLVNLTIEADIVISESYDTSVVSSSITDTLVDYLSPGVFPFNLDRVRTTQLVSLIANIPGVIYVESVSISPVGSGWLPKYGTDLLFANKGTLPIISAEDITLTITVFES
jgi:hypothetical protein